MHEPDVSTKTGISDVQELLHATPNENHDLESSTVEQRPAFHPSQETNAEETVRKAVADISSAYERWNQAGARTNEACYRLLADIYERVPALEADQFTRYALAAELKKHPEVNGSRYDPFKHGAADNLLTLLFGLKGQRSTKSHWSKVLLAAAAEREAGRLGPGQDDFVEWLKPIGIHGARALHTPDRPKFIPASLEQFVHDTKISLPEAIAPDDANQDGYALLVVKIGDDPSDPKTGEYLGCVGGSALLAGAHRQLLRQQTRFQKEMIKAAKKAEEEAGDKALLIPKSARHLFERTHFTDEDERDDYYAERKSEAALARRRSKAMKFPWELAKKKGAKLPLVSDDVHESADVADAAAKEDPDKEFDELEYFSRLLDSPDNSNCRPFGG